MKCGKAELLPDKLKNFDFSEANHIILGTGTNDIESGATGSATFGHLKEAAQDLAKTYQNAHIYVTQLPPMGDESCDMEVKALNNYIMRNLPNNTNITGIPQENLHKEDMHDPKHIRIKSLGKYVKNIKDAMRNVMQYNSVPIKNKDENIHNPSNRTWKNPRDQESQNKRPHQQPENDMLALMIKTIQQSNENMILGQNNSFLNLNNSH